MQQKAKRFIKKINVSSSKGILLPLLLLTGCVSYSAAKLTYDLPAVNLSANYHAKKVPFQVIVDYPNGLQLLNSQNILVKYPSGTVAYLSGVQWSDNLPSLIQDRLIQSFENSGVLKGLGRPGEGLNYQYRILTDIRAFEITILSNNKDCKAVVELAVRIVNNATGEVCSTRIFKQTFRFIATNNDNYIISLNKAFENTETQIVSWAIGFFSKSFNSLHNKIL